MKKTKPSNITPGIILGVIILLTLIYLAMYFSTNREKVINTSSQQADVTVEPTLITDLEQVALEMEDVEVSDISQKKMVFYVDKNFDQVKGEGDINCDFCKNRQLLSSRDTIFSPISILKTDTSGNLGVLESGDSNLIWGLFEDKSAMVLPTRFGMDDSAGDIEVPIWNYTGIIGGINANIVTTQSEGDTITYSFTKLVPVMKTAYENSNPIWLKITPDLNKAGEYQILPGRMSQKEQGYIYTLSVQDATSLALAKKQDQIAFLVF